MQNKTIMRYHFTPVQVATKKKTHTHLQKIYIGEGVEEPELSYTTGGHAKWYSSIEKQYGVLQKIRDKKSYQMIQ